MIYPKLEQIWSPKDFTAKALKKNKIKKIEKLFSRQLRSLSTKDFEKRTFSLKEVV